MKSKLQPWTAFLLVASPVLGLPGFAQDNVNQPAPGAEVQEPDSGFEVELTPAEKRCFELLEKTARDLARLPGFELKLVNRVAVKANVAEGAEEPVRQTVELDLKMDHSAAAPRTQLLINLAGEAPDFVVDWSGGTLTRIFLPENIYSQTETSDLRHDLRQCQFTADNLVGAHGDFLLRPDLVDHIRHQLVHLTDVSEEPAAPHFHLEFADGRATELWFGAQGESLLPIRMETHQVVTLGEDQVVDVVTAAAFTWDLAPQDLKWMALPALEGLRRVSDLQNEMMRADSADRIGKEVPSTVLLELSGKELDFSKELGPTSSPAVLYFWATWAAPSLREMESVQQFARELEGSGARIHPVNVGESQEAVQQFISAMKIDFPVWRDAEGKFCSQLGIRHLPAVVVVRNGKVMAVLEDVGPDTRQEIRDTVRKLIVE